MSENNQNIRHILDLARRSFFHNIYSYSYFLSPAEQDKIKKLLKEDRLYNYSFYGGSEASIRKVAVFGNEEEIGYAPEIPVCVINIRPLSEKFSQELSHRDYLGALMSLGIDRNTTGDIILKDKEAWLFCLEQTADYIIGNLNKINHTSVSCSRCLGDIPQIKPQLNEINVNAASERMDAVLAAVISVSRSRMQEIIKAEEVFINESSVTDPGHLLKADDTIVIRGFGKLIYGGVLSKTKKGRLNVKILRYL